MNYIKKAFGISNKDRNNDKKKTNDTEDGFDVSVNPKSKKAANVSVFSTIISSLSLGADLLRSGLSLPIQLHEPMTILQRSTEMLTYSELLKKADEASDSLTRLAYVVGYAVSGFVGTERLFSDFNPILGETYEWIDPATGARVIAEQVSHHPPISALHAENDDFILRQNVLVEAKFLGNSLDLRPQGRTYIHFKKSNDIIFFKSPNMRIRNIIIGGMWIEHYGKMIFQNIRTGDSCTIKFKKSGLFEGTRYDVSGNIVNSEGEKKIRLNGFWNKVLFGEWLYPYNGYPVGYSCRIWTVDYNSFMGGQYNFTSYAESLLECNENHPKELLPPTDSRLRLDREALAKNESSAATKYKKILENKQREDRKERERTNTEWVPVYFQKERLEDINEDLYVYTGNYWELREEKRKLLESQPAHFKDPFENDMIKGTACDFRNIKRELGLDD